MTAAIVGRREAQLSPWVTLVTKDVVFGDGRGTQTYHSFAQRDYVSMLAVTPSNLVPLVRQFRPAVEAEVWELPAGLVERGEEPAFACSRELKEETGLTARNVVPLGTFYPDTGRLENPMHAFFVRTGDPDPAFTPESGTEVMFVSLAELKESMMRGDFKHALHIAIFALAEWLDQHH